MRAVVIHAAKDLRVEEREPEAAGSGEVELRCTFRFHSEFALAVDLINRRRVDITPLLTGSYPLDEAVAAFEAAGDRTRSMKVQLVFQLS
jgi:threonine dehydrogenase-like Zn-dependent dehydrogenase